ncbi:hypothetical protein [Microbacterium sp. T32]|uniref:hypothetical protein n=1 Tax=Microbacterium sp. T32 TaxID=1776083 RepID=UPI0007ABF9DA|nr:hypothetical protein [Microbacterium sp. T32]KZE41590.1 hypothetical protein AVW09_03120 [Microbacterium sp. T32]
MPAGWDIAEGRHGDFSLAFLRKGSNVRVLVGTPNQGVREIVGYSRPVRDAILDSRFAAPDVPSE